MVRGVVLLSVLLAAAACGSDAPVTPSATASATDTPPLTGALTPPATGSGEPTSTATTEASATRTPTVTTEATPTTTPTPTPTGEPLRDIRATRLRIPAVGIDAPVHESHEVPVTGSRPPGCPAPAPDATTLTVPDEGIATPVESFTGLEGKSWIYGHSRWRGEPGLFFALPQLDLGDVLLVDGVDRATGEEVHDLRYVVTGIYLADTESGGALVTAATPEEIPEREQVILQTSVRERGDGAPWILDRQTVLSKAETVVEGDLDDRCKYLLLFVVAETG